MQSDSDVSGRGSAQGKGVKLSEMMPSNDQRNGDWILLPSGTEFYVLDPRAEEIHISDIAHNLAHNCRFHGSCRRHYSVAEHSLYVAHLLRHEPDRDSIAGALARRHRSLSPGPCAPGQGGNPTIQDIGGVPLERNLPALWNPRRKTVHHQGSGHGLLVARV